MGLGFELAVATVYIVEIASTDMRGILGCFVQFMGSFGVLFTYILGSFLNWYWLAMVNGLSVIIFVIGMSIGKDLKKSSPKNSWNLNFTKNSWYQINLFKKEFDQNTYFAISKMAKNQLLNWENV